MDTVLVDLKKELADLRSHLFYIQNVSSEIPLTSSLHAYVNSTTKKKFNYKSLIISTYGIIEQFSERFIIKYLEEISKRVPKYSGLKSKIRHSHLFNSAHLTLKSIENKHHKYNNLDTDKIITNLSSCISDNDAYLINSLSFTIMSGNLKHSKICDLYKQIDINIDQLFDQFSDFRNIRSENKYQKLDEIVERRNEIAHGALSNILDSSEFPDYFDFIEKYFTSLHKILTRDLKQESLGFKLKTKSVEIENVTIFNGNIIGFINSKKLWFKRHSRIIIQKDNGELSLCRILQSQFFKPTNSITLKLKPDTNLRTNQKFYLII